MNNLALSDAVVITIDEEKAANASQSERLEQTTQLFLDLTKAIKKGYDVDISNPLQIICTPKNGH